MNFLLNLKYFYQDEIKYRFLAKLQNTKWFFQDLKTAKFRHSLIKSIFHLSWFTKDWWKFLLEKPTNIRNFICRARGHAGIVFYNCGGTEPDYSCNFCDDDLS